MPEIRRNFNLEMVTIFFLFRQMPKFWSIESWSQISSLESRHFWWSLGPKFNKFSISASTTSQSYTYRKYAGKYFVIEVVSWLEVRLVNCFQLHVWLHELCWLIFLELSFCAILVMCGFTFHCLCLVLIKALLFRNKNCKWLNISQTW